LNWGEDRPAGPRRGRWSQAEVAVLRDLYGLRDLRAIARELNRSEESVRRKAEELFRGAGRTGPWTVQEVERLKRYLGLNGPEVIARILGRPREEVERQIFALGRIQRDGGWTRKEVQHFRRVYGTRRDEDLSVIFGRTLRSVQRLAEDLCLAKDKAFLKRQRGEGATRMPRWRESELALLRELYPTTANLEIARRLDRSVKSVVSKAHHLGLKKAPQRLEEMGRENVSLRYRGRRAGHPARSGDATPRRDGAAGPEGHGAS
jgi:hypothetical protein